MDPGEPGPQDESGWYEVRLGGRLDRRWSAWLDGVDVSARADGTTVLTGLVVDQAALHGLLTRVRDLGLPLISLARIEPTPGEEPPATRNPDIPRNPDEPLGE